MTAKGRAAFADARPFWQAAQARFEDSFGAQAAAELRATLMKIASDQSLEADLIAEGASEPQS